MMVEPTIKSSLQSKQLAVEPSADTKIRLKQCLDSDAFNIGGRNNQSAKGTSDAILVLQKSLNAIRAKFSLADTKFYPTPMPLAPENGTYDAGTRAAVKWYKQNYEIKRSYQTTVDDIIGRMTISSIDGNLLAQAPPGTNPNPNPNPNPTPSGSGWAFTVPSLPITIKFGGHSLSKDDLSTTETSKLATVKAFTLVNNALAIQLKTITPTNCEDLWKAFSGIGGTQARNMAQFQIDNRAAPDANGNAGAIFDEGTFWSNQMKGDVTGFKNPHEKLVKEITSVLFEMADQRQKTSDVSILQEGSQPASLKNHMVLIGFSFKDETFRVRKGDPMAFGFGAIQGLRVSLIEFSGNADGSYSGKLKYEVFDHYGADSGDWIDPGQASEYLLQRGLIKGQDTTKYRPYVSKIIAIVAFDGNVTQKTASVNAPHLQLRELNKAFAFRTRNFRRA